MSPSSTHQDSPWPEQTSLPAPSPLKRRRQRDKQHVRRAQNMTVADQAQVAEAKQQCELDSGNDVISCFPTESTIIPQHEWATFVWNSRRPELTQTNSVNIYLFHGDSQQQVLNFTNQPSSKLIAGSVTAQVNDTWFGARGNEWDGQNISFPFFWVITRNDTTLDGSQIPQATFTAVQTTFADSIVASMASSSSAAAASSLSAASASASSASAASVSASAAAASQSSASARQTATSPASATSTSASGAGSVQPGGGGTSFPKWAIAVIVVLGFFALVASGILAFFIMRRIRNRRNGTLSHRGSMGSSTPMMADARAGNPPLSPIVTGAALAGGAAAARAPSPSADVHDGASTMSRGSDAGPFSGADAAIMADAFRKALRKPDFADRPAEEDENGNRTELLSHELAEEGRDIRSVSSSRGVRVETLSDHDVGTVQDHPH